MKCSIILHFIMVYTICWGQNNLQGQKSYIIRNSHLWPLKIYNGQSHPHCIYLNVKIHQNTKRIFKFLQWICHLFHRVKRKMHIFWVAKRENEYFIRCFTTHEICIFRFTRWNKWHIHSKNLNFLFIIYNFKQDIFLALNDGIWGRTLRYINDDVG